MGVDFTQHRMRRLAEACHRWWARCRIWRERVLRYRVFLYERGAMEEKKGLGIQDLPEGVLKTIVDAVTSEMPADAIIILGSYARSEATEEFDIDILVLTSLPRMEVVRAATEAGLKMWGLPLSRDFLPMNTGVFEEYLGWNEGFARNVVEDGIVIYGEFREMRKLPQGDAEIDM